MFSVCSQLHAHVFATISSSAIYSDLRVSIYLRPKFQLSSKSLQKFSYYEKKIYIDKNSEIDTT